MIKENLIRLFENSMKTNWERPAMTDYLEKKTFTYGDIAKEVTEGLCRNSIRCGLEQ